MTIISDEVAAQLWLQERISVPRGTIEQLSRYQALVTDENQRQNLVAASTLGPTFWARHIVDSAQLLPLADGEGGDWIDLGSGPGLPGLVVAIIDTRWRVTLVESRRLRCDFLRRVIADLDIGDRVAVVEGRVESLPSGRYDVISARAFAPLPELLRSATHLAGNTTKWVLPKGRNAVNELSTLPRAWQNMFHVEPSVTSAEAHILVGSGLPPTVGRAARR